MNRLFSVRRRKPHLVDVYVPVIAGATGYQLSWAPNFDGAFTPLLTSNNLGYLDPAINPMILDVSPTHGRYVRIVFDPYTYSIPNVSFWMQLTPIVNGVPGTPGAVTLILPDSVRYRSGVLIKGVAPVGVMQLDLPTMLEDITIMSEAPVIVSQEADGIPFESEGSQTFNIFAPQGSIYIHAAVPTPFTASMKLLFAAK